MKYYSTTSAPINVDDVFEIPSSYLGKCFPMRLAWCYANTTKGTLPFAKDKYFYLFHLANLQIAFAYTSGTGVIRYRMYINSVWTSWVDA